MSATLQFIAEHLPRVTIDDIRQRFTAIDVRDAEIFAAELQAFLHERVEAVELPPALEVPAALAAVEDSLARQAQALQAATPWTPAATDLQRGRARLLDAFDQPHNLPLAQFAQLAGKSRQQIYKDIEARRLLALNVGRRGQKLPDWQLDPKRLRLTQIVIQAASDVDNWTLYQCLSGPLAPLDGRTPVEALDTMSTDQVANTVLHALGIEG